MVYHKISCVSSDTIRYVLPSFSFYFTDDIPLLDQAVVRPERSKRSGFQTVFLPAGEFGVCQKL
jgi:hypothetical protein